jgi:hypothetical protein
MRRGSVLWLALAGFATFMAGGEPAQAQSAICRQLQAQLASVSGGAPSRATARYDAAIAQQQRAIRQTHSVARQAGCDRGSGAPVCRQVVGTLRAQQRNLAALEAQRRRAGGGGGGSSAQQRRIERAMQLNGCGRATQEANVGRQGRSFLDQFFRRGEREAIDPRRQRPPRAPDQGYETPVQEPSAPSRSGIYRTVCVRTCDGYFFPISFSTAASRFDDDAAACEARCQGPECKLYTFRLPSETLEDAVSLNGEPYSALPNALRYQREVVQGCSVGVRHAKSLADEVAAERARAEQGAAAEGVSGERDPGWAYKQFHAALKGEGEVTAMGGPLEEEPLREAKTNIRDALKDPWVDPGALPRRATTSARGHPPLPQARPSLGEQLSEARPPS